MELNTLFDCWFDLKLKITKFCCQTMNFANDFQFFCKIRNGVMVFCLNKILRMCQKVFFDTDRNIYKNEKKKKKSGLCLTIVFSLVSKTNERFCIFSKREVTFFFWNFQEHRWELQFLSPPNEFCASINDFLNIACIF